VSALGLGAIYLGEGRCRFRVWAPKASRVAVHVVSPHDRSVALMPESRGYFAADVDGVEPGYRYLYRLDDRLERPDPASRHQPDGVHEASCVLDPRFAWSDRAWRGLPLNRYVIYELHVGTFTPEGTFDAVIGHLDGLVELGVTAVELMPVGQFPGERNWGYDGAYPFAVQASYGGPDGLRRLVDACHARGLAVVLDVVYNHFGPEGSYVADFGPYVTAAQRTPWGEAINYDGEQNAEVRRYVIENALYWGEVFHIDALRLDAVHAIIDISEKHILRELAERAAGHILVTVESDANDVTLIEPWEDGGFGLGAVWNDDLHHAIHALLTGERVGYYADFGSPADVEKAMREGFAWTGGLSTYRGRPHGTSSAHVESDRFIVFSQNHDQVGNRAQSERLSSLVSLEALKLAAALVILSPYIPLLFMGEEYGETAPFFYFTSHSDPRLVEAVRRGRRAEFARFEWRGESPDPQDLATFERSRLTRAANEPLQAFYRALLRLRKQLPALSQLTKKDLHVERRDSMLRIRRGTDVLVAFNLGPSSEDLVVPAGHWDTRLDSFARAFGGAGPTVAGDVQSDGSAVVRLGPYHTVLFQKR
jgi:maltooligosyltrehalose trehalohydrolase